MVRWTTRGGLLALTVGFTLGCSGLMAGFEEGMAESAREAIADARSAVAACEEGKPKQALNRVVDRVEKRLDAGEMEGLEVAFAAGLVQGAAEDGCQKSDLDDIRALNPDLLK